MRAHDPTRDPATLDPDVPNKPSELIVPRIHLFGAHSIPSNGYEWTEALRPMTM